MAFRPAKDKPHKKMGGPATDASEDTVGTLENRGSNIRTSGQLIGQSDPRALVGCLSTNAVHTWKGERFPSCETRSVTWYIWDSRTEGDSVETN